MSLRIRSNGDILCAAMHPAQPGDIYVDDRLHEYLSGADGRLPVHGVLVPAEDHEVSGVWRWAAVGAQT